MQYTYAILPLRTMKHDSQRFFRDERTFIHRAAREKAPPGETAAAETRAGPNAAAPLASESSHGICAIIATQSVRCRALFTLTLLVRRAPLL